MHTTQNINGAGGGLLRSAAQLLNHRACLSKRLRAAVIRAHTVAFAIGAEASAIAAEAEATCSSNARNADDDAVCTKKLKADVAE
jgi:hypothetical protein